MVKNFQNKNGEERRVESLIRRQNVLLERRQFINKSLTGELKINRRIRFADSDEDDRTAEGKRVNLEQTAQDNKPFSFLASIGRVYHEQKVSNKNANDVAMEAEKSSGTSQALNGEESTSKPKNQRLMSKPISLYKPPKGDGEQQKCPFFVNEYTCEIRSCFSSFRRHQKEETLRKEWEKQRMPIVKFYKKERKSALRHLRKGAEKKQPKLTEKNDG